MRFPSIPECGAYILRCGRFFYVGSSIHLKTRRAEHYRMLRYGTHQSPDLQREFAAGEAFIFEVVEHLGAVEQLSREDRVSKVREMERVLLDTYHGSTFCCNISEIPMGIRGPGIGFAALWQTPEFREKMVKARKGYMVTEETRKKMSVAKSGVNNPKSRPVWTEFKGERRDFASATAAAKHFGTSQQAFDLWMNGTVAWPGSGGRPPRSVAGKKFIGLIGGYL